MKLSVLFFSNGSQNSEGADPRAIPGGRNTGQTWLHRQTHAGRVAGEEHVRLNCESTAEGKCENQHGVHLSLEGDTVAEEAAPTGLGLGLPAWGACGAQGRAEELSRACAAAAAGAPEALCPCGFVFEGEGVLT